MSGWIKLEKSLENDPRFLRMVKAYCNGGVTHGRCSAPTGVTHLLGCLAHLWMYADTHIREDDTLDLGPHEVDEFLGVTGFVKLMPSDWLEVIDEHRIKLPGFQTHNGTEAKKKALTAKRVARYRNKNVTQERVNVTPPRNAVELPDQTRPDQTRLDQKKEPIPQTPAPESPPVAQAAPAGAFEIETEAERQTPNPVERIFNHWREIHRHPQARLDDKRRKVIRSALKNYGEPELCEAISGYLNSPHHMGQNETGTVYDALELMLRDAEHIDAGLRFHAEPPRSDLSAQTRRIISATENWTPPEMRHAGG